MAEYEVVERDLRRVGQHLPEARLPPGTIDKFEFTAVPTISKTQVIAMCAGDAWLEKGANLIVFGPPGGGKLHLVAGSVERRYRVTFTCASELA